MQTTREMQHGVDCTRNFRIACYDFEINNNRSLFQETWIIEIDPFSIIKNTNETFVQLFSLQFKL